MREGTKPEPHEKATIGGLTTPELLKQFGTVWDNEVAPRLDQPIRELAEPMLCAIVSRLVGKYESEFAAATVPHYALAGGIGERERGDEFAAVGADESSVTSR